MKIKTQLILLVVFLTLAFFGLTSDYMSNKVFHVKALDKVQSGGKHSNFYLVYSLEEEVKFSQYYLPKGYVFDQIVSASTYSQVRIGNSYTIQTRPFDIRQKPWMNVVYFFGTVICASLSLVLLISICYTAYGSKSKDKSTA